jgi:hypothetical protein
VNPPRWTGAASAAAVSVVVLAAAACGGSTSGARHGAPSSDGASGATNVSGGAGAPAGEIVARVGASAITRPQVSHWMTSLAGQFYFSLSHGHVLPDGLLSDPPRYAACVSSLEATAAASPKKVGGVTGVVMLRKCRQMYRGFKAQATEQLVRALWLAGVAADEGVKVSDAEAQAVYERDSRQRNGGAAGAQAYLRNTHRSVADELLVAREELLAEKLQQKLRSEGAQAGQRLQQAEARWVAKITCSPGYVVEHCSGFKGEPPSSAAPPVTVLTEQVATLATGRCTNNAACSKQ